MKDPLLILNESLEAELDRIRGNNHIYIIYIYIYIYVLMSACLHLVASSDHLLRSSSGYG